MDKDTFSFKDNLLIPTGAIQADFESFENAFVTQLNMDRRHKIFAAYQQYIKDFKSVVGDTPFMQWVDGSFVTKKTNPSDIDIVTFLPEEIYEKYESELALLTKPKVQVRYDGLVDAYILPLTERNKNIWADEFSRVKGRDKLPVLGKKKGFIELTF